MSEAIEAPSPDGLIGEARVVVEFPKLLLRSSALSRQPRGSGQRVMVLPGFGAGDGSTAMLRTYLRYLGYRSRAWGLGINGGDVEALLPRVIERVESIAEAEGGPVHLIGWSLGGVLAREAARDRPELVARVITLGSPLVGGPKYTAVAGRYRSRGYDLDDIEARVAERYSVPLPMPVTSIYTRGDCVVAWRASIDHLSPQAENIEVRSTHLGLGFCADVYEIIAQRLAMSLEARRA